MTITIERIKLEMEKALKSAHPSTFFTSLDQMGLLERFFPEVFALKGQHQSPIHHPEGDAFIHTMLVLDECRQYTDDIPTILAALCHDFGKGLTPVHELPRHINHENNGVPVVESFLNRFKYSGKTIKLCKLVCKYHLHFHKLHELKASTIVDLLTMLSAFNNSSMLNAFSLACLADANGRSRPKQDSSKIELLNDLVNHLRSIDVSAITSQNAGNGELIRNNIRRLRIAHTKSFLKHTKKEKL